MHNLCFELKDNLKTNINDGKDLLTTLDSLLSEVKGVSKLRKKINQEILFLTKMADTGLIKREHLTCTNLHHFQAFVSCALHAYDCTSLLEPYSLIKKKGSSRKIYIDIVCEGGNRWIKVVTRNPKALSEVSSGAGEFGQRSVLDQARDYMMCAQLNQHMFDIPKVQFHFANGIEEALARELERFGVVVSGERTSNTSLESSLSQSLTADGIEEQRREICKLNLDVTAMIAFVSSLTNGASESQFVEPILMQQAEWERARPVKPILDKLFEGKSLHCCQTAAHDFREIVQTLGGEGEVRRSVELLSRIQVEPDSAAEGLQFGGRVKPRSVVVFGSGQRIGAITVTANKGFVQAATHQRGIPEASFYARNSRTSWAA